MRSVRGVPTILPPPPLGNDGWRKYFSKGPQHLCLGGGGAKKFLQNVFFTYFFFCKIFCQSHFLKFEFWSFFFENFSGRRNHDNMPHFCVFLRAISRQGRGNEKGSKSEVLANLPPGWLSEEPKKKEKERNTRVVIGVLFPVPYGLGYPHALTHAGCPLCRTELVVSFLRSTARCPLCRTGPLGEIWT